MKNVIVIDAINDCNCDLVSAVNDNTNRLFIEIKTDVSLNPILEMTGNTIPIPENNFTYQIPSSLWIGAGSLSFRIVDDMHTGEYFQVFKIESLEGNVLLKQLSNFVYRLSAIIQSESGLPIATSTRLGGIKVGSTLNITKDGVLNANQGEPMQPITNMELEEILGGAAAIIETVPVISDEQIDEIAK